MKSSLTISTSAIYRNIPATIANTHKLALCRLPIATPINIPIKHRIDDIQL